MERNPGEGGGKGERTAREAYAPPSLRVYGIATELTRAVARTSRNADGGHGRMSKTS